MLVEFSKNVIIQGADCQHYVEVPLNNGKYKLIKKPNFIQATFLSEKITENDIPNIEHRPFDDFENYHTFSDLRVICIYEKGGEDLRYTSLEAIAEDIGDYIFFNNVLFTGTDCGGGIFVFKHYLNNKLVGFSVTEEPEDFSL